MHIQHHTHALLMAGCCAAAELDSVSLCGDLKQPLYHWLHSTPPSLHILPAGVGGGRPRSQGHGAPRSGRRKVRTGAGRSIQLLRQLNCSADVCANPCRHNLVGLHQSDCKPVMLWCRAHRDLRAALAILSMAAASRPEAFTQQHVEDLLRYGCAPGSWLALGWQKWLARWRARQPMAACSWRVAGHGSNVVQE